MTSVGFGINGSTVTTVRVINKHYHQHMPCCSVDIKYYIITVIQCKGFIFWSTSSVKLLNIFNIQLTYARCTNE